MLEELERVVHTNALIMSKQLCAAVVPGGMCQVPDGM